MSHVIARRRVPEAPANATTSPASPFRSRSHEGARDRSLFERALVHGMVAGAKRARRTTANGDRAHGAPGEPLAAPWQDPSDGEPWRCGSATRTCAYVLRLVILVRAGENRSVRGEDDCIVPVRDEERITRPVIKHIAIAKASVS